MVSQGCVISWTSRLEASSSGLTLYAHKILVERTQESRIPLELFRSAGNSASSRGQRSATLAAARAVHGAIERRQGHLSRRRKGERPAKMVQEAGTGTGLPGDPRRPPHPNEKRLADDLLDSRVMRLVHPLIIRCTRSLGGARQPSVHLRYSA